jgi:hypothetical protein
VIVTVPPGASVPLVILNATFGLLDVSDQTSTPLAFEGLLKTYGQLTNCPAAPLFPKSQLEKLLIREDGLITAVGGTCAGVGERGVGFTVGVGGVGCVGTGVVAWTVGLMPGVNPGVVPTVAVVEALLVGLLIWIMRPGVVEEDAIAVDFVTGPAED